MAGRLDIDLAAFIYLGIVATGLALVDARIRQLPEVLTMPSYPIGLVLLALGGTWAEVGHALLGMVGLLALYVVIWLLGPGFGFGDVVFAGILGVYLGFLGFHAWFIGVWAGDRGARRYVTTSRRSVHDPDVSSVTIHLVP